MQASTGAAESARKKAQGEADAVLIKNEADVKTRVASAEADAKANGLLQQSLTPQVLQYKALDTWNGTLPQYVTGSSPMPMINVR